MLVLDHFGAMELPGCGRGSACAQAAASVYGTIPGLGLPTSFIGLAYFGAVLAGWVAGRGAMSAGARWIARLGALISLGFVGIVIVDKLPCVYCLTVHGANLLFVVVEEMRSPRGARGARLQLGAGLAVFVLAIGVLGAVDVRTRGKVQQKAERDLADATRQMIEAGKQQSPVAPPAVPQGEPTKAPLTAQAPSSQQVAPPAPPTPARPGFSGRHRFGPEKATVRIVMFTDYQCPDCYKIEGELKALMASNPNVSVLIKNFPMCTDCNPKAPALHSNACWAARAAITAGLLHGDKGFWEMHHWLFEQRGGFTDKSLPEALTGMGYNAREFSTLMQTDMPLQEVKKDIEEANTLGIYFTPMIFINGVELKGFNAPQALTRAVQAVLAANPAPDAANADRPPTALEKYMADWRERPVQAIPEAITKRSIGPANAPVTVVVFGDYQEEGTREVDGILRLFATGPDSKMKYAYAYFPVDQSCNSVTQVTKFAGGCRCAYAAEGADIMAGPEVFWKVHNWLMVSKGLFTDQALDTEAAFEGLDVAAYHEAMANPAAKQKITSDSAAAAQLGIQAIPLVYVNGRMVPRWKLDNENLLPRMVREEAERVEAAKAGGR
jgi:protein-disulfide isomerase